jgi:Flp pilus assembly pilin Flp
MVFETALGSAGLLAGPGRDGCLRREQGRARGTADGAARERRARRGAASILLGVTPALGALAVIGFLVGVTPVMHDFWNQEGMDRQNEQIHFLKNAGLAGAALVFLAVAATPWPYAVGPTLL